MLRYFFALYIVCVGIACEACDSGWLSFENSCYKFFPQKKQWNDAKMYCVSQKAHLAIVMSQGENNELKALLRKQHIDHTDQVWMDGNDLKTEGTFIWEHTGEGLEITDWGPNEPNQNGGNEDCLSFFALYDFKWNDEHCDRGFGFICEKESSSPVVG